jgi:PTS system mannose-specific IID component
MSTKRTLPLLLRLRVLARGLFIQGSWNYRTLVGTGMGFALIPVLRHLHHDPERLNEAVARHAAPFNAHPYLASLAMGSLARLEADGVDEATVRRFRGAVGGPLGALGDRVVWAVWLPLTALAGLVAYASGVAPVWAVALFLVLYNVGHVTLRWWGFQVGWAEGTQVAVRLRAAGLTARARQGERIVVLLAGVLAGLLLAGPEGMRGAPWPWSVGAGLALVAGLALGARVWRLSAMLVVLAIGILLAPRLFL